MMTDAEIEELINEVMTTHLGPEEGKSIHQQCGEWQGRAYSLACEVKRLRANWEELKETIAVGFPGIQSIVERIGGKG